MYMYIHSHITGHIPSLACSQGSQIQGSCFPRLLQKVIVICRRRRHRPWFRTECRGSWASLRCPSYCRRKAPSATTTTSRRSPRRRRPRGRRGRSGPCTSYRSSSCSASSCSSSAPTTPLLLVRACIYFFLHTCAFHVCWCFISIHNLFMCVDVPSLFTICCFWSSDMSSFGKKAGSAKVRLLWSWETTEQINDAATTFEIFAFISSFPLHTNHVFDIFFSNTKHKHGSLWSLSMPVNKCKSTMVVSEVQKSDRLITFSSVLWLSFALPLPYSLATFFFFWRAIGNMPGMYINREDTHWQLWVPPKKTWKGQHM